ncbi:DUF2007 domain-containing protein [Pseudomonas aeruginosa]|uniref:putative signal transducing protein n=1 Tax=Pseudomonas aeruginosa TaxID=287 RepID=UPI001D0A19E3|nr:DUF2007 domain-containing protein [Pseudomonas aeruginosa]MCC0256327.1 DUF2007 domain-containing protein [Pseudomonas aeruginosa]
MLTTIGRFSHPLEAQIARARLEAAGIPAFVADEHTINMQWLYSNALGGVRLQVPMVCREDAVALLATDESEALRAEQGSSEFQCLRCGGDQVAWKVDGRRLAFLGILLLNVPLWPIRRRFVCEVCGFRSEVPMPLSE